MNVVKSSAKLRLNDHLRVQLQSTLTNYLATLKQPAVSIAGLRRLQVGASQLTATLLFVRFAFTDSVSFVESMTREYQLVLKESKKASSESGDKI
ncbi:hypothetical protein BDN71DRAFT_1439214 [Pleurotus eryngii]|uniref:Uncharacterized protein n=1 Tax=Pleurotus eryngii TaxID=5323 RepID=A0A9P6DE58_PLEER|nr:hypothetical protein BDN71DRAFT_1439214 [Pleurotus eryngii]